MVNDEHSLDSSVRIKALDKFRAVLGDAEETFAKLK